MVNRRSVALGFLLAPSLPAMALAKPKFAIELLSGEFQNGIWSAGLAILMEEGWKTYWRMPGDAGVPPEFNWSKSVNAKEIEVRWPAPHRYQDGAGETVGYMTRVVFPLRVTPADPAAAVTLDLEIFFAMCKDVCIPASAKTSLMLATDAGAASIVAAAEAHVPTVADWAAKASLAHDDGQAVLRIQALQRLPEGSDIFVEGFDAAYFRAPRWRDDAYMLPIDGLKSPDDLRGKMLKLTLVTPDKQLEQSIAVD